MSSSTNSTNNGISNGSGNAISVVDQVPASPAPVQAGRGRGRRSRTKRGTIMLLALGVLGILSVSAIAYVTIVRLDRESSIVTVRQGNYQQQADAVVNEIGSVIAADLFGNKIVTSAVPVERNPNSADTIERIWPSMFEDGEYTDVPSIAINTFDDGSGTEHELKPRERAVADDAWLASIEPKWEPNVNQTRTWPQITNLRSAYRYVDGDPTTRNDDKWERGDGRFVDLAQWFMNRSEGNADPSVDLLDPSYTDSEYEAPSEGNEFTSKPAFDNKTKVFDKQMNGLEMSATDDLRGRIAPSDERRWVDTDGDLRSDARWTLIDGLGNVGGLNWVVAARIVDLSALVNYNSAIESGANTTGTIANLGNGRTPADVDLLRILKMAGLPESVAAFEPDPRTDRYTSANSSAFNEHLRFGLALPGVFEELYERDLADGLTEANLKFNDNQWTPEIPTTRLQREQFWLNVGQSPTNPRSLNASVYPVRDLTDLMTYWGTNNSTLVSRAEQFFDGPQDNSYLPVPNDPYPDQQGPMRSKENGGLLRELIQTAGSAGINDTPTPEQLKASVRRLLTPVSGVGTQGPVPVLNDARRYLATLDSRHAYATQRVPLNTDLSEQSIRDSFASLVWALAPFATDQPLAEGFMGTDETPGTNDDVSGSFTSANSRLTADVHYGGTAKGPAGKIYGSTGPAFAIITAASMAANIADAVDNEQDNPSNDLIDGVVIAGGRNDSDPTVLRIINDPEFPAPSAQTPPAQPVLGTRLPQGDIPEEALPMANPTVEAIPQAITVVGVERQPYFREVMVGMFYSDTAAPSGDRNGVIGNSQAERLGGYVVVELSNPWDTSVALGDFAVIIPETESAIYAGNNPGLPAPNGPVRLDFEAGSELAAGTTRQFVWITSKDDVDAPAVWDDVFDALLPSTGTPLLPTAPAYADVSRTLAYSGNLLRLDTMARDPKARPVLLVKRVSTQKAPAAGGDPEADLCIDQDASGTGLEVASFLREAIVDRISPPGVDATNAFPPTITSQPAGTGGFALKSTAETASNAGGLTMDAPYFQAIGLEYDTSGGDTRWTNPGGVTGQMLVSGSLARPSSRSAAAGGAGFPAWVMEFGPELAIGSGGERVLTLVSPGLNSRTVRRDVQAWFYPVGGMDRLAARFWGGPESGNPFYLVADNGVTNVFETSFPTAQGDLGQEVKTADSNLTNLPSFQLFVPDAPLHNASELLMVSAFANVYLGPREADRLAAGGSYDTDGNGTPDLFANCQCPNSASPARPRSEWIANDLLRWRTASEQMAMNIRYDHSASGAATPNPYVGVLDPSRFILSPESGDVTGDLAPVPNLPDSMALPLALRVPDCFEALDLRDSDGLVQGRININTAPVEVLRALPLLDPESPISAGGATLAIDPNYQRVKTIAAYRQPEGARSTALTGLLSIRGSANGAGSELPPQTGFATPAELAVLGNWDDPSGGGAGVPTPSQTDTMLVLGADGVAADAEPLQVRDQLPLPRTSPLFNGISTNPVDDPEERMALYRAVSNIATARSDVYAAWFVIRGYDPETIERIEVDSNDEQDALNAMDLPANNFAPAYESRWFVVFDRSNVRKPNDRPRVLLQVELPVSAN